MQPVRFSDIIGQQDVVARLKGFGGFFASKGTTAGHILLTGEDGMGKETLANVFANEMGVGFQKVDASELKIIGDLTALVTNLKKCQVLLLSNLQWLRQSLANQLRSVHDYKYDIIIGQGPAQRTHVFDLQPFTLIATCPKKADCPQELLSEFSLVLNFQPYTRPQLQAIAESIASKAGASLESGVAELIAQSCDRPGAIDIVFRRLARAINKPAITKEDVSQAFLVFGINVRPDAAPTNCVGNLQHLSGQEFERLIAILLSRMGFHAEMTKTSGDGGIDIIAMFDKPIFGGRYLFQCKRFTPDALVGAPTVRDFYGAVRADNAMKGIFITTSDFTMQAREFGERVGLELINSVQLQKLFLEYGMLELENG
ncbi:MAG: restriction endonuclease [Acidobacteriaceae bacterium]